MALTTLGCAINENGVYAPEFADILDELHTRYSGIYGADVYTGNDAKDEQLLGVFAAATDDLNQSVIAAFNNFSPQTAVGVALSQVVKVNGLARLISSRSTVPVRAIGTVGVIVTGGLLADNLNRQWTLADFTIPVSGEIIVTATCQTEGDVSLPSGIVMTILSPVPGWQSATSSGTATPGAPVETDAALRQRQSISVAQPALTSLESIVAGVLNLTGVTRVTRVRAWENDSATTDGQGVPSHSLALVVRGGDAAEIAAAIAVRKPPGSGTFGTTSEVVMDANGVPNTIRFYFESEIAVHFMVDIHALTGYLSTTGTAITAALIAYVETLTAGETLYGGRLGAPLNLTGATAPAATGRSAAELALLTTTYDPIFVAAAREDMTVTGGPVAAGATTLTLTHGGGIEVGSSIYALLDDNSRFTAVTTAITTDVNSIISFSPSVPAGRTIPDGRLIYTTANLIFALNEAATGAIADVTLALR